MLPNFSGKQINKAGDHLTADATYEDEPLFSHCMSALSYWRHSHEEPLENARKLLVQESINKDKSAIFAKRLKRHASIVRKLKRFPGMKLKNMQDIGGCRAIVSNKKKLMQIVRELRKKHNFKGSNGSIKHKDYIAEPKEDGYRGYHLIGSFECADGSRKSIELQLRTRLQHNWATTLEIVDLFTGQALKSNQGTKPWTDFFVHTSKQFAAMEDIHLFEALPDLKKKLLYSQVVLTNNDHLESCKQVQVISSKLNIVRKLNAYSNSLRIASDHWKEVGARGYVLLEVNANEGTVKLTLYPSENSAEAETDYTKAEQQHAKSDEIVVALVSATALGGIKEAYPNYFADSTEFLKHLLLIQSIDVRQKFTLLDTVAVFTRRLQNIILPKSFIAAQASKGKSRE